MLQCAAVSVAVCIVARGSVFCRVYCGEWCSLCSSMHGSVYCSVC